jgi:two-component system chemotaxis response regulator CheB
VVALAASTGGPPAIQQVLAGLPADFPLPVLVVQHIAKGFSDGFTQWLNSTVALPVTTALAGAPLTAGHVHVAPEGGHLGVSPSYAIEISDAAPIAGFRPSASYLFNSVAGVYRDAALAVIMTGMGSDGLEGLRAVKQCGGTVIAQDEASSVVFGMPGVALEANVVDDTVGLEQIARRIQQFVLRRTPR